MTGEALVVSKEICVRGERDYDLEREYGFVARPSKWALQRTAQRLLGGSSVAKCNIGIARGREYVTVRRTETAAWFQGVVHCGSVWGCPVCARKIGEHRREEMQQAIDAAIGARGGVALLTFTFSHQIFHKINDLMPRLAHALRLLKSGRKWQALKEEYGIYGSVRALEVTHGKNGWHPHVHEIEFFERPLNDDQHVKLQDDLFSLWRAACIKAGLGVPTREHGIDVRRASHAAKYVSKWGFASEVTRPASKRGWSGSTPWQILEDAHAGSELAERLFLEFFGAFKGRRQLFWSKGLRERLGLGEELSDEQQAELELVREEDVAVDVVDIDAALWKYICRIPRAREVLLDLVLTCEHNDEVRGWLDELRRRCADRLVSPDGYVISSGIHAYEAAEKFESYPGFYCDFTEEVDL